MGGDRADGAARVGAYLAAQRGSIVEALESLPGRRGVELDSIPGAGGESLARIVQFCLRGKMIRGCLVFLGAEAAVAGSAAAADSAAAEGRAGLFAACAAAMELFQAGLLAHDDIMDRDELRRGAPTLHALYAAEAQARGSADALHVGEALGICLGDLCYFEAFAELARALAGHPRSGEILGLCSRVLSEVAVAQMADVRWGGSKTEVGEDEILAMYR
jgi:geranylgeranyl diphosphate synthase type I